MTSRSRWFAVVAATALAIALGAYTFRARLVSHKPTAPAANETHELAPATESTPRAPVDIDQRRQQLIGVRTVEAKRAPLSHTIRTVGVVKYDETRQSEVNVRVEGSIRELFADYTGQLVQRGQALLTLYSPQILGAESEYLLALQSRDQLHQSQIDDARQRVDALVTAARQRLSLWDLSEEELAALDRDRRAHDTITVAATYSGFVVDKPAVRGMHVMPGQTLYKIADLSNVWVEADVYENEMSSIRVGQAATVTLDAYPNAPQRGRVIYIYPYVDEQTRTNKVRYAFANPQGRLKPGMYAHVEIDVAPGEGIVVPTDAVLDSGKEQIVFVAQGDGHFDPRRIRTGRRMGSSIEIADGIQEGERVAAAAAFFLDSESQLRGSLQAYESSEPQRTASATASQLAITFTSIPNPPRVGENQFEVAVKDASGTPVSDGGVSIQFFMAAMPTMNMPAMRNVVNLQQAGGGLYRGTGQVLMGGRWETTITVTRSGQRIGSRQLPVVTH